MLHSRLICKLGDAVARGVQVSVVQLVYSLSSFAGPLIGGFLQVQAGPIRAFLFAGLVRLCDSLPLLSTADTNVTPIAKINSQSKRFAAQVYFFDGFGNASAGHAFALALFITLNQNFQAFGFA